MDVHQTNDRAVCPACGHKLTAATAADGQSTAPTEGDLTVCFGCAALLEFQDDLTVKLLTTEQLQAMPLDHLDPLIKAQQFVERHLYAQPRTTQ